MRESAVDAFEPASLSSTRRYPDRVELNLVQPIPPVQTLQVLVRRGQQTVVLDSVDISEPLRTWPANSTCGEQGIDDPRPRAMAFIETGWFVDSFAGIVHFENAGSNVPQSTAISKASGRPFVSPILTVSPLQWRRWGGGRIWLDAQVVYGVKQVPCSSLLDRNDDPDCVPSPDVPDIGEVPAVMGAATSAEAYPSFRFEWITFGARSELPMRLYFGATSGSVFVLNSTDSKARNKHRLMGGLRVIGGSLRDSFVEFGQARNELVTDDGGDSFTGFAFTGTMVYAPGGIANKVKTLSRVLPSSRIFVRFALDRRHGRDSLETLFGLSYDFSSLAGAFVPAQGTK